MSEYISKNRVKDFIHATNSTHGFTSYEDYVWLMEAVINTPAADVQLVKHGKWERINPEHALIGKYRCSLCRKSHMMNRTEVTNFQYCPNCGAKMDGDLDE